ncbi:binding--dependent transport system inner membrane component family protein, partial [Yersinia pestis PY-02]|uniref:ABC transporter permease n=1 Tax=Yersinia pestis TaxID=632 RepID=UPI000267919B
MPKPQKALKQKGAWLLRGWKWVFNFYSAAILLFLIVPVLVIVPLSFNAGSFLSYPMAGFSLRWYQTFFNSDEWLGALGNSLLIAPLATLLATGLGVLAAIGLGRGGVRG